MVPSLVNGGFETGDLTGWVPGNGGSSVQQSGFANVPAHTGNYYLALGAVGSDDTISQTVADTPGQAYDLQFFYYGNSAGPSDLNIYFNGNLVYTETNAFHGWQEHDILVTGTAGDTVAIAGRNDPTWDGIDDMSLEPVSSITPAVVSTTLTGTVAGTVTDDLVTFNEPVDPSTFTFNQFNLTDPNGNPVNVDAISTFDNTTYDVTFDAQSATGTYAVSIGPNIADFSGHTMAGPYTTAFTITNNLIVNGGFENGDAGWADQNFVAASGYDGIAAHGGNYFLALGAVGSDATTSQTVSTTPGQAYNLEFFYYRDGGTPSDLNVYWSGTLVYSEANLPAHDWQQHDISVTGTGSDTLSIGGLNDPSYDGIDDVSLVATSPAPHRDTGGQSHGQELTAFDVSAGTGASGAAATVPVAQSTSGGSHQVNHAALVDHIFSGQGTKDNAAAFPGLVLPGHTTVDPLGQVSLGDTTWLL